MLWCGMMCEMPPCIALPKVSFSTRNTTVLGAAPAWAKTNFWLSKASLRIIGPVGKLRNTNL